MQYSRNIDKKAYNFDERIQTINAIEFYQYTGHLIENIHKDIQSTSGQSDMFNNNFFTLGSAIKSKFNFLELNADFLSYDNKIL